MLATYAQAYPGGSSSGDDAAALVAVIAVFAVFLFFMLAITVAICFMLYTIQSRVPVEHQKISPAAIWLLLIPLFGLVWNFLVFQRIPESYKSYSIPSATAASGIAASPSACGTRSAPPVDWSRA